MSDIERYLSELRSHLTDLHPKRADEIVAEARTHLESRAAQLQAAGLNADQAASEAARTFGDPSQVAQDLVQGNTRHRRPAALRVVAALVIGCGSFVAVNTLINSPFVRWEVIAGVIRRLTGLGWNPATALVECVPMVVPMLLVGIIGGRRFWWLAAVPIPVAVVQDLTGFFLRSPWATHIPWTRYLARMLPWSIVYAAFFLAIAWLGARLSARTLAGRAVSVLSSLAVLALWLAALASSRPGLATSTGGLGDPEDFGIAILIVLSATIPFLVAARRDRWLSRDAFIVGVSVLCAIGLLYVLGLSFMFSGEGRYGLQEAQPWLTIAALACGLGLLGALIYWRRTQPEPSPGQRNLPPG